MKSNYCDCRQGRDPCTCKPAIADSVPPDDREVNVLAIFFGVVIGLGIAFGLAIVHYLPEIREAVGVTISIEACDSSKTQIICQENLEVDAALNPTTEAASHE